MKRRDGSSFFCFWAKEKAKRNGPPCYALFSICLQEDEIQKIFLVLFRFDRSGCQAYPWHPQNCRQEHSRRQIVMLRCNKIVELLKPAFKRNRIASTKKNGFVEIVKIFIDDE